MEDVYIIAINPGSTSTKIAVYRNKECIFEENIKHSADDLAPFEKITDQFEFRKRVIMEKLNGTRIEKDKVRVIMGRGGLVYPIESGVYRINEKMKHDLVHSPVGEHASNLGGFIAEDLAKDFPNAEAFICDPVVTDELDEIARIAGHPEFTRRSVFHALNQKATARRHATAVGKKYEELNLIVAHLGGGISIGAHRHGRVVDVNHAIGGEGPFSPERAGSVSVIDAVKLAYSGKYSEKEFTKMLIGKGGLCAHLGTNNAYEVEHRVKNGDEHAALVYEAMAYQVAKFIGMKAVVLKGKVDGILITGGIAYDKWFVGKIREYADWIGPFFIYPGENEMEALAMNALRVINGEVEVKEYQN
ncbi:MAG TPA: butyrate kinase [Bacteroidales bacterium]|nr:butyrate kinase [Bacteroidales bacterium]